MVVQNRPRAHYFTPNGKQKNLVEEKEEKEGLDKAKLKVFSNTGLAGQIQRIDNQPLPVFNSFDVKMRIIPARDESPKVDNSSLTKPFVLHSNGKPKYLPKLDWSEQSKMGELRQDVEEQDRAYIHSQ